MSSCPSVFVAGVHCVISALGMKCVEFLVMMCNFEERPLKAEVIQYTAFLEDVSGLYK